MTAAIVSPDVYAALQAQFLEVVLPFVQRHGEFVFRHVRCPGRKEDAIQEMLGLCWKWFLRLVERGKDPTQFPTALATYAAVAVRCGRRLTRPERTKDVLSSRAQRLHGFKVESLPLTTRTGYEYLYTSPFGQRRQDAYEERLRDNTKTPVPEQVCFRLDFPAWVRTRTDRDRRVIGDLMAGERTTDVADEFGLTAGRVSQLRRDFQQDWTHFCGDHEDGPATA